ncbi:MAG: hypothetical protein A2X45_04350 [Lentisphaerae bacterium GWF2_50_93]|nr:MAG: hypothetical protein A2X45_04350 [Lentisphaerae bacterium GWF2_50_93]
MLNKQPIIIFVFSLLIFPLISFSQDNLLLAPSRSEVKPFESLPSEAVKKDGRTAFKFPCNFQSIKGNRNYWDITFVKDLSEMNGFSFEFKCTDPSPVAMFSLYFHSGEGWYSKSFYPSTDESWEKIRFSKDDFGTEGKPAGWDKIDTMRISAWLSEKKNTEFLVANFAADDKSSGKISVIVNDSEVKKRDSEKDSIFQYTNTLTSTLDELGISYRLQGDLNLTPEKLKDAKLVIIPFSPNLDGKAADTLSAFIRNGGKLIVFYVMPSGLEPASGIKFDKFTRQPSPGFFSEIRPTADKPISMMPEKTKQSSWNANEMILSGKGKVAAYWFDSKGKDTGIPAVVLTDNTIFMSHVLLTDDISNKKMLLLSMLGYFLPEFFKTSAEFAVSGIGRETPEGIDESARATKLINEGKFIEAITSAGDSRKKLVEAYCRSQSSVKNERRLFWCHSAFGVEGKTWDEAIKILADNGFTDVIPNMLCAGLAYYRSDVLPVAPEISRAGDQIEKCLAACRKYGIKCHVWKVNWNTIGKAPSDFMKKMKSENRLQVNFNGKGNSHWLCPSSPENRQLEIESMLEIVRKYEVDGIHFDYIRFPDNDSCFCERCRAEFEKSIGEKLADWPKDARSDKYSLKWNDFRRNLITTVVAEISKKAKEIRSSIQVSAAVFGNWQVDRDLVGQDWKLWCEKGYVDFVCPMDYTDSNLKFKNLVAKQKPWAGKTPFYPGIGISTWNDHGNIQRLIKQIEITRKNETGGFTVFEFSPECADYILPLCGKGITGK